MTSAVRTWFRFFGLLLGTAFLAFWSLGSLPLIDVDEPVYGQVGKEMAHAGLAGWLSPRYGGQLWFDKPPLFYWLTALSMQLFGVNEFAARLPSALLSVVLVASVYALARRAYPSVPRAALWAGFVLATSVQFFTLARAAVTDMTLALCLILALYGLYAWVQTNQGRWIALAGLMTGLGMLTKGPVALVLIGVQTLAYLLLTRQPKRLLSPALWLGFALCLGVGLPWFLLMIHLHGQLFINGFLEANNVTRYLQAEHQETSPVWYFLEVLPLFFFPWSLALPWALVSAWRQGRIAYLNQTADNPTLFLGFWAALVFVFFSASQSKLVTYIFPLYPAIAILVGAWLAKRPETLPRFSPLWIYAAFNLALGIALWKLGAKYEVAPVTLLLWMATLLIAAVLALVYQRRAWVWLVPGTATAVFLLLTWCSPTWRVREADISDRQIAVFASLTTPPDGVVHALGLKHPSLRYYTTWPVVYTDDHPASALDIQHHPGVVYALRPKVLDELRSKYGATHYEVLQQNAQTVLVRATGHQNR
jgi:4-amino-4-deoxy-L-arabinose transferase-like glycosyltransferase